MTYSYKEGKSLNSLHTTLIMGKMKVRTFIMGKLKVRTLIMGKMKVRTFIMG